MQGIPVNLLAGDDNFDLSTQPVEIIKRRPRSLADYVLSNAQTTIDRFVQGLSFGGGAVNQTPLQCVLAEYLPFGGVGASGLGRYYGKYGFDSLSYMKSVVISPPNIRIDPLLPPYTREDLAALNDWFAPAKAARTNTA